MSLEQLNIVASFFGALTALVIFTKWKNQKGSEVVAIEAREVFNLIERIPKYSAKVLEDMLSMSIHGKVPNDFDTQRFNTFRDVNVEILKRLKLIGFKNNHKDTIKLINQFEESYKNFSEFYHQSNPIIMDVMLSCEANYKDSFTSLKNEMYSYALYIKTI